MLPVKEAAKHLGVSASLLYAMVSRRTIPHYKVGAKLLFRPEDLDAYLEACRVGAVTPVVTAPRVQIKLKHLTLR